ASDSHSEELPLEPSSGQESNCHLSRAAADSSRPRANARKMSRLFLLDSSSSSDDDDDELILTALHQAHTQFEAMNVPRWGGSVLGRQYIHRDRESGHWRLFNNYFS
ncbi:unnamed protein product, partial [Urochloa humidicola]